MPPFSRQLRRMPITVPQLRLSLSPVRFMASMSHVSLYSSMRRSALVMSACLNGSPRSAAASSMAFMRSMLWAISSWVSPNGMPLSAGASTEGSGGLSSRARVVVVVDVSMFRLFRLFRYRPCFGTRSSLFWYRTVPILVQEVFSPGCPCP